ncbi:ribosomal protein S19 family protein [Candidatus Micrarchaeota archaeon]|nr:ribosomal protein S19 family protein [Candidatus Micrarchaeota archaeon]MBU1165955.1 ribosomal protein S19 family protein [Candidatus Micrarchaeota archaeon]MBU1886859.1 ribosomal protein S19 family protein [Candidatus Micrarchaeota archaeon]
MMKIHWKGIDENEVHLISDEDFLKRISSRNRKTLLKLKTNPRLKKFMEKVKMIKEKNPKKLIKTQVREAIIMPSWIGLVFGVHNGKEYKKVEITVNRIGKRLGDFAFTIGRVAHSGPGVGATRGSKFVPLK